MSGAGFQHANDIWRYMTNQPEANKVGPLGVRAGILQCSGINSCLLVIQGALPLAINTYPIVIRALTMRAKSNEESTVIIHERIKVSIIAEVSKFLKDLSYRIHISQSRKQLYHSSEFYFDCKKFALL